MNITNEKPVIIYDGQCSLCQRTVSFLLSGKPAGFSCIPSSDAGSGKLLKMHHLPLQITEHTVVLIEKNRVYTKSGAVIKALQLRGGMWRLSGILRIIPEFIRNFVYDRIAGMRKGL